MLLVQVRPSIIAEKRDELLAGFVRSGKLRSPTTVVRYLSSLSHVFSKAVKEWEWMRENPIFKIEKPKQAQGRKRILTFAGMPRERIKRLVLDRCSCPRNGYAKRRNNGA